MNIEHDALRLGKRKLHFSAAGEGHPLVLIHGLAGSERWWMKNFSVLAEHFRVYAVDMAGFGRSRGQPFELAETADLLLSLLDELRIEQSHLIGHSMGGYVTTTFMTRWPERVDRVVLVDAAVLPIARPLPVVGLRLAWALRYMPFDFLPILITDTLKAGPLNMIQASRAILRGDLRKELARIQADLLIVWGEFDTLLPVSMGEELSRQLPAAQFVVVKGAGHNPMWDRPKEFNELVIRFLKGDENG